MKQVSNKQMEMLEARGASPSVLNGEQLIKEYDNVSASLIRGSKNCFVNLQFGKYHEKNCFDLSAD
jgi:hypothetical protein